jgi:hypothetical protein
MEKDLRASQLEEVIIELYADIKQEISNKPQDISQLKDINIFQVVDYLRQSIELLVGLKVEKVEMEMNENKENTHGKETYENLIRKLEKEIRHHIRVELF